MGICKSILKALIVLLLCTYFFFIWKAERGRREIFLFSEFTSQKAWFFISISHNGFRDPTVWTLAVVCQGANWQDAGIGNSWASDPDSSVLGCHPNHCVQACLRYLKVTVLLCGPQSGKGISGCGRPGGNTVITLEVEMLTWQKLGSEKHMLLFGSGFVL